MRPASKHRKTATVLRLTPWTLRIWQIATASLSKWSASTAAALSHQRRRAHPACHRVQLRPFYHFERTMQLNDFGCLRVTMGLLPGMVAKKKGHVVNISSIGVLTNAPAL